MHTCNERYPKEEYVSYCHVFISILYMPKHVMPTMAMYVQQQGLIQDVSIGMGWISIRNQLQ